MPRGNPDYRGPRPGQEATALVTVAVRHTATAGVRGWGFFRGPGEALPRYYGPAESRLRYRYAQTMNGT